MRILVLGGDGMLGHQLLKQLSRAHEVRVTLHRPLSAYAQFGLFNAANARGEVDVRDFSRVVQVHADFQPDAVLNAAGVVKQRVDAKDSILSIEVNSLLPHRLAELCGKAGTRLIHMSTDCVFSGKKGNYSEADAPDAEDLYGRSKLLGEVSGAPCLTLRSSIIGRELSRKTGLLEWFLGERGPVRGFRNVIFSGFTTIEMTRIIERLLTRHPGASGLYHVSSAPISKHDLLVLIRERLELKTDIVPDGDFRCDRSLDSSRFRKAFGYVPPTWEEMVEELA